MALVAGLTTQIRTVITVLLTTILHFQLQKGAWYPSYNHNVFGMSA